MKKKYMYKISEFSKITSLTVKALRYYDEQGILYPSEREANGYRMYSEDDFKRAESIKLLKNFGFTIVEIKDTLENCESEEDLYYYLTEKKSFIEKNIAQEKAVIDNIDKKLSTLIPEKGNNKSYTIQMKKIEPLKVVSVRFRGQYSDIGNYIGTLYKELRGKSGGAPFNCYFDDGYKENADIELCVPYHGTVTSNKVTVKSLSGINALSTVHLGGYDTLNLAYKAIIDYAKNEGYICKLPSREVYIKGPGRIFKGNPEKYVTEILVPIDKAE